MVCVACRHGGDSLNAGDASGGRAAHDLLGRRSRHDGRPTLDGWASLTRYTAFPRCNPSANGSQEVAVLAIAETTVQYEYPLGAYIVTGATTPRILQTNSTHAVLGFAVVVNVTTDWYKIAQTSKTAYFSKDTMTLTTVCHLVPTLAKLLTIIPEQLSPQIYGTIDKNSFTSQHTSDD
ncbi:hypothetical protein DYB36_009375 [Aphanomyces astaci]|uniref:Uncharacterized protein n=1 Tax=Aphanomyces astaci TaxID=112090 RepID=A0A396ZYK8_APHAT|nr:hypothetical protein DYB36_009375 [Aphanomyces astaci]